MKHFGKFVIGLPIVILICLLLQKVGQWAFPFMARDGIPNIWPIHISIGLSFIVIVIGSLGTFVGFSYWIGSNITKLLKKE